MCRLVKIVTAQAEQLAVVDQGARRNVGHVTVLHRWHHTRRLKKKHANKIAFIQRHSLIDIQ